MNFTKATIQITRKQAIERFNYATSILNGDVDNYDGLDGARYVVELSSIIKELCEFILSGEKIES